MGEVVRFRRRDAWSKMPRHMQIQAIRYINELSSKEAMRVFESMLTKARGSTSDPIKK